MSTDGFPGQPGLPGPRIAFTAAISAVSPDEDWRCSAAMTELTVTAALDHLDSWKLALRAENKAPGTIAVYADCTTRYLHWCTEHDRLPMSRTSLNQWVAGMLDGGNAPGTARIRQQAVRRFATWLTAGGDIPANPFPGMKAPPSKPLWLNRSPTTNSAPSSVPAPHPTSRTAQHPQSRRCTTDAMRRSSD